jgi:hypothetical protein
MDNKAKAKRMGFVALRTVILVLLTAAISALSRFLFRDALFGSRTGEDMFAYENLSEQVLSGFFLFFFLLIFNSLIIAIDRHDSFSRERFFEIAKNNKLATHLKFIVSSLDFYVELGCVVALSLVLPTSFLYGFVSKLFFSDIKLTAFTEKLYTLIIILPIVIAILFIAHVSFQRGWYTEAQIEKAKIANRKKESKLPIVKNVINVAVVYCIGSFTLPFILPMLFTLWDLGGIMLFVWIVLAVAALVLLTITVYYVRALLKRRAFVRKLKKYCFENSLYLSDVKNPYRSIFFSTDGLDFTVEKNMTSYDCKFISCVFPRAPMVLTDDGWAIRQINVRMFKRDVFSIVTNIDFYFESENKKILVLLPTPKVFVATARGENPRLADVGEVVGKYTVYTATGFLNALDRDTL